MRVESLLTASRIATRSQRLLPVASLLVACQLASMAHLLLVPHALDAQGRLVHPDRNRGSVQLGTPVRGNDPGVESSQREHAKNGHDPCVVAESLRQNPASRRAPPVLQLQPAATTSANHDFDRRPEAGRLSVFRLAPKQSPPV